MSQEKKPRLEIKPKKVTDPSVVISIRIPRDMLQALDEAAEKTRRTRNEIISMGLEFALENFEISDE